ncbi:MAG: hisA/hisF family protein [Planctomycetes bacterium]|nr:hisA/hisF family protein [Planctomycetota bacterium]
MRIIPVIDLKAGLVVHGVAGRRDEYRPIVSTLTSSSQPIDVARALIQHVQATEIYLADLDAINGQPAAFALFEELRALGVSRWIDAGVRTTADALALANHGIEGIICALESLQSPSELATILATLGPTRVIFSLDLKQGMLLGDLAAWSADPIDPWSILRTIHRLGIRRLITLDLASVGVGQGVATLEICRQLKAEMPEMELITGGGIRNRDDLRVLDEAGVDGVLVASALHQGLLKNPHHENTKE